MHRHLAIRQYPAICNPKRLLSWIESVWISVSWDEARQGRTLPYKIAALGCQIESEGGTLVHNYIGTWQTAPVESLVSWQGLDCVLCPDAKSVGLDHLR